MPLSAFHEHVLASNDCGSRHLPTDTEPPILRLGRRVFTFFGSYLPGGPGYGKTEFYVWPCHVTGPSSNAGAQIGLPLTLGRWSGFRGIRRRNRRPVGRGLWHGE